MNGKSRSMTSRSQALWLPGYPIKANRRKNAFHLTASTVVDQEALLTKGAFPVGFACLLSQFLLFSVALWNSRIESH
jgi:hypothetical protein